MEKMNDEEYIKELGLKILWLRKGQNMTQEILADRAGINRATVIRLENGTSINASIVEFRKISRALNIELKELVDI